MSRKPYPSDLTDAQWEELAPLLQAFATRGHPRTTDLREVVNGILYVLRGGIPWRMLPQDLPPRGTVWWYFGSGGMTGLGNGLRRHCGPGFGKRQDGRLRPARPSSTASRWRPLKRGPRGYDAGKRVAGRKRHIVDTPVSSMGQAMGLLLAVMVHAALRCCPTGGWWSVRWRGLLDADGSAKTMRSAPTAAKPGGISPWST